jgi:hypothetical protein
MSLVNYKEKYLKYKKKYLELKGGANCPKMGFFQHLSECWHDALMMIFLFSDGLSEHTQKIFDETSEYKFDLDDCMKYAIANTPSYLKPINISPSDNDVFMTYAKDYIRSVFERYENEKLSFIPYDKIPPPIAPKPNVAFKPAIIVQPPSIESKKVAEEKPKKTLYRRDSINQTLSCNYSIFKITNINNVNKMAYKEKFHGGIIYHTMTSISLYNYFLLNYFPEKLEIPKNNKFVRLISISLLQIFNIQALSINPELLGMIIDNIILSLDSLSKDINSCVGIVLDIVPNFVLDKIMSREPIQQLSMGHAVAFMKCGGKEYFYDNNGVNAIDYQDFEITAQDVQLNTEEVFSDKDDELTKFRVRYREQQKRLMVPYNWKAFLLKKIETTKSELAKIKTSRDISKLRDLILGFSECFYGHNPNKSMTIGNNMLKSFFIDKFNIITKHDLYNEESYNLFTAPTLFVNSVYTNEEAMKKLMTIENLPQLIFSALQNKNTKLMDYITEHSKLGPVIINQIKDSILQSIGQQIMI